MTWWFKEMLLHLVPYLINFCFSDAEEKQNKEGMIETNTQAQMCACVRAHTHTHNIVQTITNSWENREGGRGNMSRDLVTLLWAVYNTRDAMGGVSEERVLLIFFSKKGGKKMGEMQSTGESEEKSGRMRVSFPGGSIMELFFPFLTSRK